MRLLQRLKSYGTLVLLLLAAWPFLYYWPASSGQKVFAEGDIQWLFLPIHTELARALAQGGLPLWSPAVQAGFPLFAQGQVAALYPLNLLLDLLLPVPTALSFMILLNLAWAGIGMYVLVRASGLRVPSALLASLVFASSGFFTAHISHVSLDAVAAWLPWLILLQLKMWQARRARKPSVVWFSLLALAVALQLLDGHTQIAALNLAALGAFSLFSPLVWSNPSSPVDRSHHFSAFWLASLLLSGAAILLGLGVAAVQLLPSIEYLGLSDRAADVGRYFFTSYSMDPAALLQFILPFKAVGQPTASNMEFWGYVGVLPFLLAIVAPFVRPGRRTVFLCLFGVVALSLALGGANPLYNLLYLIPVLNRFRAPARFLLLFVFAVAWLAAVGFDELQTRLPNRPAKLWTSSALALLIPVIITGTIYLAYDLPVEIWLDIWQYLPALLWLLSILVVLIVARMKIARPIFALLALGLTLGDLAAFSAPFLSTLTRMSPPAELVQVPRTLSAMDNTQAVYRINVDKFPSVTPASVRATLWSFLPMVYGKQAVVTGYVPGMAVERNSKFISDMSLEMRNLIGIRYYMLPLETAPPGNPSPFNQSEPEGGLTLDLLRDGTAIPPTPAGRIEITSYTDGTQALPNGFVVGEVDLTTLDGRVLVIPLRLGAETADWAYDGLSIKGKVNHTKPAGAIAFPAYTSAVGREFQGHKYVAEIDLGKPGPNIATVRVRSFLPGSGLTVESMAFIDDAGHSVSLAALLHRDDLSLVFRSHTAAVWENRNVLPRAFVVHQAERLGDEQTLARLRQDSFQPARTVILSSDTPVVFAGPVGQSAAADATSIDSYTPERVEIRVRADQPGYLVLTDTWYPGWVATVDGTAVPIYRADSIFRAISLTTGSHVVVFEYHPNSFYMGIVISAASLLACAFLGIGLFRRASGRRDVRA